MTAEPEGYQCPHVTELAHTMARLLESVADVQNSLAMECETAFQAHTSMTLYRAVRGSCDVLGMFLASHDPDGNVRPPELSITPPVGMF